MTDMPDSEKWVTIGDKMAEIFEEYYKEIVDADGNITDIELSCPEDFNFAYDVIDRHAKENPLDIALVHKSVDGKVRKFTFEEITRLSNKAANVFRAAGIGKKDPVMLLLKRRYEFWISVLALHKLGAVTIPTSHMVSDKDIEERIKCADAKAIVCVDDDHICDRVSKATEGFGESVVKFVVGSDREGFKDFDALLDEADDSLERVVTKKSDDMLYYFTSGTSGEPKAVIHDFSYPIAHIFTAKNWHGVKPGYLHLTVADSGWAKSAWGKMYGQWFMGAAIMVYDYEQFYAADMLKLIEEVGINTFCAPPTIYKYFVREDLSKYDFSKVYQFTTAGEYLPIEISKRFTDKTGKIIRECFGQTETVVITCTQVGKDQIQGSIGKASPLYDVRVVDEDNRPVPVGEEGEIVIVPKERDGKEIPFGIFKGYLGNSELYSEVWEGGVYHTCDKAYIDENGYFYFKGRNDDVIKSSGYRIGPSEVEDIIMKHPAVFECAVTGYPSKTRGMLVKASIVLNKGYEAKPHLKTEIQEFVKERAAIYKYPRMIEFVESLPKTSSGKISRAKIREADNAKIK